MGGLQLVEQTMRFFLLLRACLRLLGEYESVHGSKTPPSATAFHSRTCVAWMEYWQENQRITLSIGAVFMDHLMFFFNQLKASGQSQETLQKLQKLQILQIM